MWLARLLTLFGLDTFGLGYVAGRASQKMQRTTMQSFAAGRQSLAQTKEWRSLPFRFSFLLKSTTNKKLALLFRYGCKFAVSLIVIAKTRATSMVMRL